MISSAKYTKLSRSQTENRINGLSEMYSPNSYRMPLRAAKGNADAKAINQTTMRIFNTLGNWFDILCLYNGWHMARYLLMMSRVEWLRLTRLFLNYKKIIVNESTDSCLFMESFENNHQLYTYQMDYSNGNWNIYMWLHRLVELDFIEIIYLSSVKATIVNTEALLVISATRFRTEQNVDPNA